MPNRIAMFHMPCSISGPMPILTNSFKHAVLGWQSCVEDFIDCYLPVGIDAFPGRLHVAWHMTRRIGYVNTRQAWNRYTFTVLVRDATSLFQKWHEKSNILGAVFSGNRLLRRNQSMKLQISFLRFTIFTYKPSRELRKTMNYVIMQQFWCYPGTATCYCWNEMSNSSYSSVFYDFSGVLDKTIQRLGPQALPEAMPQGIKKFAYSLRLRPRHFIAQYLPSGIFYANFLSPG
ncbi:hypothetical protein T08_8624, partial [Trichinella sp. T8]